MLTILSIPLATILDRFLGEPSKLHPLVGFGHLANSIESKLNQRDPDNQQFIKGVLAWLTAVIPIVLIVYLLSHWLNSGHNQWMTLLFNAFFGWLAIGWQSLRQHGQAVATALANEDIELAREKTSYLVSRDTSELDETGLSRATIESILENGSDAVIAPLFWLTIAGAPGVVLYRLVNTLDAMWGYHNHRFELFGKFTAIADDIFNYIPARICALLYVVNGNSQAALKAWKTQGKLWYSPNAGVVMAAGAGGLNIKLGGSAVYQGEVKSRPVLGDSDNSHDPKQKDIQHAIKLLDSSIYFLSCVVIIIFIVTLLIFYLNP